MTIKEAVEFYNQQKEEIRILKKVKENVMRLNSQGVRDPFGDIHMRTGGEVGMSETVIILSVLGTAAVACIVGLIVITFKEKKMKRKPTYYSAVGNWLSGKRR